MNVNVWQGRNAGQSDVGVFVSDPQKKYSFKSFETRYFEAEVINGKVMLVKYACSDDGVTFIRQVYTFTIKGQIQLHKVDAIVPGHKS